MAFSTRLQGTTGTTGLSFPTSLTTTAFSNPTQANSLILVALMVDGLTGSQTFTMTDTANNTYTRLTTVDSTVVDQLDIWACFSNNGGASHTITAGNLGNTTAAIIAEEWKPSMNLLDVQQTALSNTGLSTAVSTGASAAPTYNTGIVWVAGAASGATNVYTAAAGYTNLTQLASNPSVIAVESKVMLTGGAQTGAFTLSIAGDWCAALVVIPENGSRPYEYLRVGNGMSRGEVAN